MTGRNLRVTVEDNPAVCDTVGCTNNTMMYINPFSDIVTSMGGLEAQFVTCMGIVFHEIAHCVYLDFDEEKRACEFLKQGMLYGDEPLYDFATNIDIPVAVAGHNDRGSVFFKLYTGFEKA